MLMIDLFVKDNKDQDLSSSGSFVPEESGNKLKHELRETCFFAGLNKRTLNLNFVVYVYNRYLK